LVDVYVYKGNQRIFFLLDVCVYKGNQYYQDQAWTDGCDYQCSCTNAKLGTYQCEQL